MADCIFCKIAAGEIPSTCVWDEDGVYAFTDLHPQAPVHVLVIPKAHIASVAELDSGNVVYAAKCLEAIPKIARKLGLDDGYRVISNVGENGGQTVHHLHFHLLGGIKLSEKMA